MTGYRQEDLTGEWEFKFLRSNTRAFAKPDVLRRVVEEEARAGWVLLEKFDDMRLRFKRPISARDNDHRLDFDPYRSHYGKPMSVVVAMLLLVGLTVAGTASNNGTFTITVVTALVITVSSGFAAEGPLSGGETLDATASLIDPP